MDEKRLNSEVSAEAETSKDATLEDEASAKGLREAAPSIEDAVERALERLKDLYDPYWREEAKKAFQERDEAKRKLRELESKFEDAVREAAEAARREIAAEFERRLALTEAKHLLEARGCLDPDAALKLLGEIRSVNEAKTAIERLTEEKPYLFGARLPQSPLLSVRTLRRTEPASQRDLRKLAAANYKS